MQYRSTVVHKEVITSSYLLILQEYILSLSYYCAHRFISFFHILDIFIKAHLFKNLYGLCCVRFSFSWPAGIIHILNYAKIDTWKHCHTYLCVLTIHVVNKKCLWHASLNDVSNCNCDDLWESRNLRRSECIISRNCKFYSALLPRFHLKEMSRL